MGPFVRHGRRGRVPTPLTPDPSPPCLEYGHGARYGTTAATESDSDLPFVRPGSGTSGGAKDVGNVGPGVDLPSPLRSPG